MKYRDENGNWQDLYLQPTGDTLPIGAEVDYDGEDVPYGWERVDNPEEYSTSEVKTNKKWIDGKPIYRKVIDFGTLPNNDTKQVNHNINNLGVVILITGVCYTHNNTYYPLPLQYKGSDSSYNVELDVNNTQVVMISSMDRSHLSAYVILEYTKTTD